MGLELKEEEVAPLGLSFLTSPMLFFLGHASPPRVRTDRRQVFLKHNQTHYRFPLIPGPDRDRARWRPAQAGVVGSQDLRSAHDHERTRGLATRYTGHDGALCDDGSWAHGRRGTRRPVRSYASILSFGCFLLSSSQQSWRSRCTSPARHRRRPAPRSPRSPRPSAQLQQEILGFSCRSACVDKPRLMFVFFLLPASVSLCSERSSGSTLRA